MAVIVRGREPDAPKASFPPDLKPGEEVPKGGSNCGNCKYLNWDKKTCSSQYFIRWHGSPNIPLPDGDPTRYCSIWWEAKDAGK